MSLINKLENVMERKDKLLSRIVFRDKYIWARNAREQEFRKKYPHREATTWIPGFFAYYNIKNHIKDTELSQKQRIALITLVDIPLEIALDALRAGLIYGLYCAYSIMQT